MKKTFTLAVLFLFALASVQAQISLPNNGKDTRVKIPQQTRNIGNLLPHLDLESIKNHIAEKKYDYHINLTLTAIIPPKHPTRLKAVNMYYKANNDVKVERNYLRVNGLLLRGDHAFRVSSGNNFEVLIYPDRNDKRFIDKNGIKITWRSPEKGLQTFNLKNVSIQYKKYGILIIGEYEIDGIIFGASIALHPTTYVRVI